MTEKEIQPIALDGKIIDFKTKEVIEDLDAKNKKRFTICVDSNNLKSLWDDERTEEEPLLWLTLSDRIGGIDNVCELLNDLNNKIRELETRIDTYDVGNKTIHKRMMVYKEENEKLKALIKKTLETTPIEHTLAIELKNSVRELYD